MKKYTKLDIAKIIKKPVRTITYWTDFGLIIPDIQPSQGRGIERIYSENNLIEFHAIKYLSNYNVPLKFIQFIIKGGFLNVNNSQ